MPALYKFRIRRGWGGVCVLQQLIDSPSFSNGRIDASVRQFVWLDVKYDCAPTMWEPVEPVEFLTEEVK